jgi:uncharacterized membrane protein YqiK
MPNQVTDARVRRVSFVERAATRDPKNPTQPRRKLLWKSEDAPNDPALPAKGGDMADMTPEEMQAALAKAEETAEAAEKDRDTALAKAETAEAEKAELEKMAGGGKAKPAKGDDDEDDEDEMKKSELPEAVRAHLEKADAEMVELRKRAESAEELAKGEREARVEAEFVEMAKSELPHLGKPEVVGKRLKTFSETLEKADYDEYVREQTAINEQLRKGSVEAEYGRSGGRPAAPSAPGLPEAMKKAEELQKGDPNMSSAEAFRRAMRDPAVAAEYEKERAGA